MAGEHSTITIVESQLAAFSRGDVDAVLEHFTEDCVVTIMMGGSQLHGRASVRKYLEGLYSEMPSGTARITSVVADGLDVAVEIEVRGRWTSEALGDPASGVATRVRACLWTVLEGGRIREQRIYGDPRRCGVRPR